jgi:hypothetical protein
LAQNRSRQAGIGRRLQTLNRHRGFRHWMARRTAKGAVAVLKNRYNIV